MEGYDDAATELKEIGTAVADLNARLECWNRAAPVHFGGNRFEFRAVLQWKICWKTTLTLSSMGVVTLMIDRLRQLPNFKVGVKAVVDHVAAAKAVLFKAFADTSTIEVRTMMKMMPKLSSRSALCCKGCWAWSRIMWRLLPDLLSASPNGDGEDLEYLFVTSAKASMEARRR